MARPRSDIQQRIAEVALDVFSEKGVDGASLRSIAREADTNIGMIYYYYPTKEDLFLGVVEEVYEGWLERFSEAIHSDKAYEERLEGFFGFPASLSEHELRVMRLVLREILTSNERMEKLVERAKVGHVPMIIDLVGQGFREGKIERQRNPFIALACLAGIGMAPHLFFNVLAHQLPEQARQLGDNPQLPRKLPQELKEIYLRAFGPAPGSQAASGEGS